VFRLFEARSYRRSLGGEEMKIHRKKVKDSSLIRAAGWNNAVLSVQYQDGTIFNYQAVPENVYSKLLNEDSAGAYWLSVRDKYEFREVKK
jgi:hypothetical protein